MIIYQKDIMETMRFSGGERSLTQNRTNINYPDSLTYYDSLTAILNNSDDIMDLLLYVENENSKSNKVPYINIPYLPYARADRRIRGQGFGLKVMSNLINSLNIDCVNLWDVHSDVALGLINNAVHHFFDFIPEYDYSFIVAPDAGAEKRTREFVKRTYKNTPLPIIQALKYRDTQTGRLTETRVMSDKISGDVLIVDDICDGGGTFIALAKELKKLGAKNVDLFVSHGIFSNGLTALQEIRNVYYSNSRLHDVNLSFKTILKHEN